MPILYSWPGLHDPGRPVVLNGCVEAIFAVCAAKLQRLLILLVKVIKIILLNIILEKKNIQEIKQIFTQDL